MDIKMHEIPIKDIAEEYEDNNINGVHAYKGKLNVRPPFQREFISTGEQRSEVIYWI